MKRSTYTLRRLLALVLVLVMVCSVFAGCSKTKPTETEPQPEATAEPTVAPTDAPEDPTEAPTEAPTEPEVTVPAVIMGTVNADNLNVRSEPYSTADILKRLAINSRIEILEQKIVDGVNWGRIAEGWLNLNYVTIDGQDPLPGTSVENENAIGSGTGSNAGTTAPTGTTNGVITATELNIREKADANSDSIGVYVKGDKVKVLERNGDWGRTDMGWISLKYVDLTGTVPTTSSGTGSSSTGSTSSGNSTKVSDGSTTVLGHVRVKEVSSLAVRTGPGTQYSQVGYIKGGENHDFFQKSGSWVRIKNGWVNSSYTTLEYTIAEGTTATVTTALHIREEASASSNSLATYKAGAVVSILEVDGGWGMVEYATGCYGWINLDYVKFPTSSSYTEGETTVTASALHIREKASASSNSLGTYKKGDKVTITAVDGNWGKTDKGWINLKYTDMAGTGTTTTTSGKYTITIKTPDNGTLKANGTTASKGATITLTATPSSGYKLGSVEVVDANGDPVAVTNNKTFVMPEANVTVKATFIEATVETFDITISSATGGSVTTNPEDEAAAGTKVYLTVSPDAGYALSTLSVKDSDNKTVSVVSNSYFTMPEKDVTITATFAESSATYYDITVGTLENGEILLNKSTAVKGDKVTMTIQPAEGYALKSITVKDSDDKAVTVSGSGNSRTFTMPEKDVTVSAEFSASQYNVSVSKTGQGNVAVNPTKCSVGTAVTVAITPDTGYQLAEDGLKVYGPNNKLIATGDDSGVSFNMPATDVTVKVIFELIPHDVNVSCGSEGTVTASKTTAAKGDKVTLTIKPDEGYTVDKVTVKDSADKSITVSGSGNSRSFTMPADDVDVEVTFKLATYTVKTSTSRCKVSVSPASTNMGETVTVTIVSTSKDYTNLSLTAKTGTTEVSLTEESSSLDNGIYTYVYTFEMPAGNVTVTAKFTK